MRPSRFVRGLCVLAAVSAASAAARAEPPAILLPLQMPITGTRDIQLEAALLRQLERLRSQGERGVVVLRFEATTADDAAAASDFGRSLELAKFLSGERLVGIKTVAWLPEGAAGHAVLAALACEEIVMPPDAVLGPAATAAGEVDEPMRAAYVQIAARRRTIPPAVALALLDPAARVVRAATDDGEHYVAPEALEELKSRVAVLATEELRPLPLQITGRRAREFGFVQALARSPTELARSLGVAERSLAGDPSLDGGWRAAQVTLSGAITPEAVARARGRIERAVDDGANLVCLRIESDGGAAEQSLVLANWIAGLDPARVRTVAYVPREARGDAALVALACDELVAAPRAVLGGAGASAIGGRLGEAIVAAWRGGVAKRRDRDWSLPAALVVPGIVVQRAVEQGTGRVAYYSEAELESRADREAWQLGQPVGTGPIQLDGRRAGELGLATHVVDDFAGLVRAYGVEGDVALADPGWADRLLEALASPSLAWLLLLIGGAGLWIELKTPGVGFGGFVSMVAFIVYFWSQHLHGTSGWLEVMLFIAGVICVAAEIFVLPGFGVLGLGGGLLVVAALVLASQSFVVPVNEYQIRQMQWSLAGILGAGVGVAMLALVAKRWLPSAPLVRDVLLEPPAAAGDDTLATLRELVGAEGTTTTRLAPAGKARLAGAVRDVSSLGMLIEPGTAVRVVEVRGGRVLVAPAAPS